ncbi:MAG TPA: hypothetical protein VD886_00885, partial [Herpetosiphonaceae bacterium]|nr:hypothetical protein [Herpetosiphonaceae bacterium]
MNIFFRRAARLALALFCAACSAPPAAPAPGAVTTLVPERISLSAPEIANPGRGLYRWREQTMACPAELKSDMDAYNRWTWAELEPAPGAYDWSAVRAFIDAAAARRQRVWL